MGHSATDLGVCAATRPAPCGLCPPPSGQDTRPSDLAQQLCTFASGAGRGGPMGVHGLSRDTGCVQGPTGPWAGLRLK